MNFEVGQQLHFIWAERRRGFDLVTVAELRSRGQAKLSNGWTVNKDGLAEGTKWVPGGHVVPVPSGQEGKAA